MTKPLQRYTRVSKTGKRKLLHSHDLQEDTITAMGERHTLPLSDDRISDTDKSGKDFNRDGWNRVMELLHAGLIGGVAVATMDRFVRNTEEGLAMARRIQEAGGELWVEDAGGKINLDDENSLLQFVMRLVFGHMEWMRKAKGLNQSRANAIAAGRHLAPVYGYDRPEDTVSTPKGRRRVPMTPNPKQARTVLYAYQLRASGMSWKKTAAALNAKPEHRLPEGEWTWTRVRSMIRNTVYLGVARSGEYVNPNAHDAIVSAELWEEANYERTGPTPDPDRDPWLLSGLLRCGACGYRMTTKRGSNGARYYGCKANHKVGKCPAPVSSLNADEAEAFVWEAVKLRGEKMRAMVGTENMPPDLDAAYDRAFRSWKFANETLSAAYRDGEPEDVVDLLTDNERVAKDALNTARTQRDASRKFKPRLDARDFEAFNVRERKDLIRLAFPAIFTRRSHSYREPVTDRIELRDYAPAGLNGGTVREAPVRSFFT
jgi:DNA invertase Pin-like site-specific DNA recombinase